MQNETKPGLIVGKGIRGGIVVGIAVLLAAVVYSGIYFSRGLVNLESGGLSIILVMVWACIVAVLLVVMWQRMLVREEYLRNFYLSDSMLFNFELGAMPLDEAVPSNDVDGLVSCLESALPKLTYDHAPLDPPAGFSPTYCVSSARFSAGKSGEDWHGSLQRVQQREDGHRTYVEIAAFQNAADLKQALTKHNVLG